MVGIVLILIILYQGEGIIDPWLTGVGLAHLAKKKGAEIITRNSIHLKDMFLKFFPLNKLIRITPGNGHPFFNIFRFWEKFAEMVFNGVKGYCCKRE